MGICVYSLGFPLVCFLVTRAGRASANPAEGRARHPRATGKTARRAGQALSRSYSAEFWYWESLEVLRKYLLTSVVSVVEPNTELQMYFGAIVSVWSSSCSSRTTRTSINCAGVSPSASGSSSLPTFPGCLFDHGVATPPGGGKRAPRAAQHHSHLRQSVLRASGTGTRRRRQGCRERREGRDT